LAARHQEDEVGRGPAVRERRGALGRVVGRWVGQLGLAGKPWPEAWAGRLGWKRKGK
jgi:hypothetical protein